MSTFVFRLIAPRPTFALDMTDEERNVMERHAAYWQSFIDSGQMVIFGPVLDTTGSWASVSWRPRTSCAHSRQTIRRSPAEPPRSRSARCSPGSSALAETTRRRSAVDAVRLVGPHGDLDAISGAELGHHAGEVSLDGAEADVELVGDLTVRRSATDHAGVQGTPLFSGVLRCQGPQF